MYIFYIFSNMPDPYQQKQSGSLFDRLGGRESLALLLHHFYADARQHRLLGPIFQKHIGDWPVHLASIAEFWARATGGPSQYRGMMPAQHFHLGLAPEHFDAWLSLWAANCRCRLPAPEAEEMIRLAGSIARTLKNLVAVERAQSLAALT